MDDRDIRDILIRVEQQLKDSVVNQSQIVQDMRTAFARLEKEAKTIASLKVELKSHLEASPIRKEELNNRIKYIEERHSELKQSLEKFKDEIKTKSSDVSIIDDIEQLEKDFLTFKTEISTSISVTRWIFGAIIVIVGLVLTVLEILSNLKG